MFDITSINMKTSNLSFVEHRDQVSLGEIVRLPAFSYGD